MNFETKLALVFLAVLVGGLSLVFFGLKAPVRAALFFLGVGLTWSATVILAAIFKK